VCAGDRHEQLPLHPTDTCRACAWLASHWAQAHQVLNLFAAAQPSRFASDPPDDGKVP